MADSGIRCVSSSKNPLCSEGGISTISNPVNLNAPLIVTSPFTEKAVTVIDNLDVTGVIDPIELIFGEVSSIPQATTSTQGAFWVRDDAPTVPIFTDSTGTDFNLLAGVAPTSLTSTGGTTLVVDGTGPTLSIKGLTAGTDISIVDNGTDLEIVSLASGTTLSSAGGTETLVVDGVGPTLSVKGLTAGTGISLTGAASDITITNTDGGSGVTLASAGGTSLVVDGVGPTLSIKGLTGSGIATIMDNGTDLEVSVTNTTLSSAGGVVSLVDDGTGPALAVNGLTAGTGISLGLAGGAVTITNTDPAGSVTLQGAYDNSGASPFIVLDDADGGIFIRDDTGPAVTGNLFAVQNNAASMDYFAVSASEINLGRNTVIDGNLSVMGTTTTIDTQTLNVTDNFICLNKGYDSDTALRCGQVYNINPEPGSGQDTVAGAGFTAGVAAVSNPTVATTSASTFADTQFVIITGANDNTNNGVFEVLSHAANLLTIRGVGTTSNTAGIDFLQNQFATDATVAGTITRVEVSVFRARTDGDFEIGAGSDAATINGDFAIIVESASSAGGTESLVAGGTGPDLSIRGLTAGTGISLTGAASDVTITNTDGGSSVTLSSAGGTETLVVDGTGPTLSTKGLTAGTAISLTGGPGDVTISSTGANISLSSAGGTETLVVDGTGPTLSTKGLTAGTGISLTGAASAVTIAATGPTTFTGLTDTPASYPAGSAFRTININAGETALEFSNNVVGTNTDATNTSIAMGASSTVAAFTDAIAIGSSAMVGVASAAAIGPSAMTDIPMSLLINYLPMINDAGSTGISLGLTAFPGGQCQFWSGLIDMTSTATLTWTIPAGAVFFCDQIDFIKTDATATIMGGPGMFTFGGAPGSSSSLVGTTPFGPGTENTTNGRLTFSSLSSTTGRTTLVFDITSAISLSSGSWMSRVGFKGTFMKT